MRAAHRRFVLWILLLALPVQGVALLAVDVLGSSHRHREMSAMLEPMAGWTDFRRAATAAPVKAHHGHDAWLRHGHSVADDSVTALDGGAQSAASGDAAGAALAALTLCLPCRVSVDLDRRDDASSSWPRLSTQPVVSVTAAPPERPPRA